MKRIAMTTAAVLLMSGLTVAEDQIIRDSMESEKKERSTTTVISDPVVAPPVVVAPTWEELRMTRGDSK